MIVDSSQVAVTFLFYVNYLIQSFYTKKDLMEKLVNRLVVEYIRLLGQF